MSYPNKPASGRVLYWRDGPVGHIRFNRPEALNAVDNEVAAGFLSACTQITEDPMVRVLCLSAEGKAFMAGGDIKVLRSAADDALSALIQGMHSGLALLSASNAPVVACVQGAVMGAGLGLVLSASDLIIAAEGTRFGVAYPLVGASCDCSTSWALPRAIGLHRALELALLGSDIDATEALRLGLCNRIVPASELQAVTANVLERFANGPTRAYGSIRRLIRESLNSPLPQHLVAEANAFLDCAKTQDFREGTSAFLERRQAHFSGR